MGRSFIIRSKTETIIPLKELLQTIQNLPKFSIDLNKIEIHDKKSCFCFSVSEPEQHYIFMTYSPDKYVIESRALPDSPVSYELFLAVACAVAVLTNGTVNSGDGAWNNADKFYSGKELWTEFIAKYK